MPGLYDGPYYPLSLAIGPGCPALRKVVHKKCEKVAKIGPIEMEVIDARKLPKLGEGNRRLKQLVGELSLDNQALKCVIEKKSKARTEEKDSRKAAGKIRTQPEADVRAVGNTQNDIEI